MQSNTTMAAAQAAWDNRAPPEPDDEAHDTALYLFHQAVEADDDRLLPLDNRGSTSEAVSALLTRYGALDQLLKACHLATTGRDNDAVSALLDFMRGAADAYADDNAGAWL